MSHGMAITLGPEAHKMKSNTIQDIKKDIKNVNYEK